jgi:hypothetical protein
VGGIGRGLAQTWTLVNAHGQFGGEVKLSYSVTNLPAEGGSEESSLSAGGGAEEGGGGTKTKRRGRRSISRSITGKMGFKDHEVSTLVLSIEEGTGLMGGVSDQADKYVVEVCAVVTVAYFGVRPARPYAYRTRTRTHTHTHMCASSANRIRRTDLGLFPPRRPRAPSRSWHAWCTRRWRGGR